MKFNSSWSLQGQTKRFLNRFIYTFILTASGVLLTACVSSSGGGGGGGAAAPSAPSRVGVFSHAVYDFVLANTTQAGRNQSPVGERRLGLIQVEEAEIRARLPEGAVWQPNDVRYTIVGGANDLTRAFFKLDRAALLFEAAPRYASRTFTLDYVVNTLGIDALRVVANVSYVDAQGARQTLGLYEVPVTMRAVAEVPAANDFVVFDGLRESGSEARRTTTTNTRAQRFEAGMLRETINITAEGSAFGMFTARWTDEHYVADADEQRLYAGPRAGAPAAFDLSQLVTSATPRQTRQDLAVAVRLTLNNNSATQVSDDYVIAVGTNLTTINGASTVPNSFLAFVRGLNATTAGRSFGFVALDANDRLGSNVTAMAWSFTFPYTADVTTSTTRTRSVRVSRLAYTAEGAIDENVAGRTSLSRSAEILRTLGIRLNRPAGFEGPLPTLYFQVANANVSEAHCETAFYLDQGYRHYQNYQIKAQASPDAARPLLNHEARDAYACQMEVSLRGTNSSYRAITTGNLTDTNNQTTAVSGTAVDLNVVTCGSANATTRLQALRTAPGCIYRADVDIAVRDINEPVELNFEAGVRDALDEANVGLAGARDVSVGTPLNTSASDPVLATFTYREPDQNATGGRLDVAVPQIRRVVPAQVQPTGATGPVATAPLFYIEPRADERAALMLNASIAASVLDYEALAANATGQRGFRITLQATDNSTARLVTERVFNLEVQDVVYAPVRPTYTPLGVNYSVDTMEQRLLPGFAQFVANGGPVLGRVQAVDPETNTSAGLAYAYVGVAPFNDVQNRSFVLSQGSGRALADELLLVGVGLRDGDDFNVRLRAINESPRANVTEDMEVRTVVDYAAVDTAGLYTGAPPIQFNAGAFVGSVVEGRPGAEVSRPGQPGRNIGADLVSPADDDRSFFIMTQEEIGVLLGTPGPNMRADVQRALARSLDVLSDPTQFNLNRTTGALSLDTNTAADFTTQPVYTLLLRVANTTEERPAPDLRSDYALVQVVVEDTNTAPALVNLRAVHETVSTTSSLVRLTDLPEDTPAGTVLATLQVKDDNPLTGVNFAPAAGATAYKIERTVASQRVAATADEGAHYIASYRLVTVAPDYEANATLDVVHALADNGRYGYDPMRQMVVRSGNPVNTTVLRVNGSVTDVDEAPMVRLMSSRVDLAENAAQGDAVVTVRAEDPEGLAANLTYTLVTVPASLAAAFDVRNVTATVTNEGRVATWALEVADAEALENAGDGQIFTLTLTARDLGGLRARAYMEVSVQDVPVLRPAAVNVTLITLSEQQALDAPNRVLRSPLFRLVDVQPDYDEYFFGLGPDDAGPVVRFGELAFAPGAISYVDAQGMPATTITDGLHNAERFNLFTLQEENAAVNLVLGEAGLIEPNLLGNDVRVEVRLSDPAGVGASAVATVPVTIVPTRPVGLRFAHAGELDEPLVPAAYTLSYRQTGYVPALAEGACVRENATHISYDGRCYPAVSVRAADETMGYVARDLSQPARFTVPGTVAASPNNEVFNIVLRNASDLAGFTIYQLDAAGNLGAAVDFAPYFSHAINHSYDVNGVNHTALVLRPRTYATLDANGSVAPDAVYRALDTLPLDSREGNQERVLSFFVVAGDSATNARRRAIAQVNVVVESPRLNTQARVTELRLGDLSFPVTGVTKRLRFAENGAGEDDFPLDLVNNPRDVLTVMITNLDSDQRNQTVNATIDVLASATNTSAASTFMLVPGRATGHELVRLGPNADERHHLILGYEAQSAMRVVPFQLARNVHGQAFLRVRFEERDARGRLVEDPYEDYFEIVVDDVAERASNIAAVRVADRVSPVNEDGFGTASPQLNVTLTNEQFTLPRNLTLINVAVDAANSPHADLAVNMSVAPQVVPVFGHATLRYVLQGLTYKMHAHGTTTFTVRTRGREPRGFDDELHTYAVLPLSPQTFEVTSVNDPLRPSARSEIRSSYLLQTRFSGGQLLDTFVKGTGDAVVYFTDVDLATGGMLPVVAQILFEAQPLDGSTMINPADFDNASAARMTRIERVSDTNDVRVAFPVRVRLSREQYDAINAQEDGVVLNVTVRLADGNDNSVRVAVNKPLIAFVVATDNATLASVGGYTGVLNVDEATADGTVLPLAAINITDADIRRTSGDTYTYGLDVTRARDGAAVPDLLAWRDVNDRQTDATRRTFTQHASASFLSALQLAKEPQDADVGSYAVNWAISEARSANGSARAVGNGTLMLHIVNVNDAIAVAATPAPVASGYHLQQDFGVRTAAGRGLQLRADKEVRAYLRDDDLLLDNATGQLPTADAISIVGTTTLAGALVQVEVTARAGVAVRAAGGDGIEVTVPLNVALTPAQYDVMNRADATNISFMVQVRDGNTTVAPRPMAAAMAMLTVTAGPNDVTLDAQIAEGALFQLPTNVLPATQVGVNFTLNDPTIQRSSGDTFIYGVNADPTAIALALEWASADGAVGASETIAGETQDTVMRFLRTGQALTDADHAGFYNVSWSLDDGEAQLRSHFRLNVTDVDDPLVAAAVVNVTYDLGRDFNATGNLTAAIQDLVFFFTDADLSTAASTAARGGAASVPNVLDLMPELGNLTHNNRTEIFDRAAETRLIFGLPNVTRAGADLIRVAVPVNINLTQAQYDDLLQAGAQTFHIHVTLDNRDVYGAAQGTNTSMRATIALRDFGRPARAMIPANTYAGGEVAIYREQARIAHTVGAGAVFLNGTHQPQRINITDVDFASITGDTYMYELTVTNSTDASIMDLLEWDASAPTENIQQASPSVLRGLRYQRRADPRGPRPGVYTVVWSITEAKGGATINRQVAGGNFTLTIQETPTPQLRPIMDQTVLEGRTEPLNITMLLVQSVPGEVRINVSSPSLSADVSELESIALQPGNRSEVTVPLGARNATVSLSSFQIATFVPARPDERALYTLDDEEVRSHRITLTAITTNVNGEQQLASVVFNVTVANVNDPLSSALPRPIGGTVERGGQVTFSDIALEDRDRRAPGHPLARPVTDLGQLLTVATIFDSNLKVNFTAPGITSGVCELPRVRRPARLRVANNALVLRSLFFNLTNCVSADGFVFPAGINNLYDLSQRRPTVRIVQIGIDNYAEFVGPRDVTDYFPFFRYVPNFSGFNIDFFGAIHSVANLTSGLANYSADVHRLEANLTLTSWTPMPGFAGLFDGNNHTITLAGGTGPLFETINSSGTVQNLGIISSTLARRNDGKIFNVYATGNSSCATDLCKSGGLVGENHGTISHSYATGNSSCSTSLCKSGGLIGENTGTISNSYAIGKSTCFDRQCESGGLVGSNLGPITASYAIGTVLCSTSSNFCTIGGLVGGNSGGRIIDSYATGNRTCDIGTGVSCRSGGLLGSELTGITITNAYATGEGTCGSGGDCTFSGGLLGTPFPGVSLTVISSYRAENVGTHGTLRTLAQLRCPTMANQTCAMANTYEGWNNTIWDFGTADDLPTLHDLPDCPTFRPNCRH